MLVVFSASIVGVRPVCFLPIEARRLRAQVDLERTGKFFRHWVLEVHSWKEQQALLSAKLFLQP